MKIFSYAFVCIIGVAALPCCAQDVPDEQEFDTTIVADIANYTVINGTLGNSLDVLKKTNEFLMACDKNVEKIDQGSVGAEMISELRESLGVQMRGIQLLARLQGPALSHVEKALKAKSEEKEKEAVAKEQVRATLAELECGVVEEERTRLQVKKSTKEAIARVVEEMEKRSESGTSIEKQNDKGTY